MQPTMERTLRHEPGDGGASRPTTFILPDLAWAALLAGITRDARTGDVIEVHTPAMYDEAVRRLHEAHRDDVTVVLRQPRGMAPATRLPTCWPTIAPTALPPSVFHLKPHQALISPRSRNCSSCV